MQTSVFRAELSYETFRNGLKDPRSIPAWDKAPGWVRDAVLVAYLQGTLDGPDSAAVREPRTAAGSLD